MQLRKWCACVYVKDADAERRKKTQENKGGKRKRPCLAIHTHKTPVNGNGRERSSLVYIIDSSVVFFLTLANE